jgi:hypothetical protein
MEYNSRDLLKLPAELQQALCEACEFALLIQSACNASGVIHALNGHVTNLWKVAHALSHNADWVNRHPVLVLAYTQLCHLAQVPTEGAQWYSQAFDYCEQVKALKALLNKPETTDAQSP